MTTAADPSSGGERGPRPPVRDHTPGQHLTSCAIIDARDPADYFGARVTALSETGHRVMIGSPTNRDDVNATGYVRVLENIEGEWTLVGDDINGLLAGGAAGWAAAMNADGTRVAVGSSHSGEGVQTTHVYELIGGAWTLMGEPILRSGESTAMNAAGDRVVIGGGSDAAAYQWSGAAWSPMGETFLVEDVEFWGGADVAMNDAGDRVVLGGFRSHPGAAGVFEWREGEWSQMGETLRGNGGGDQFGLCVSMDSDGDRVLVGARHDAVVSSWNGMVAVYEWTEGAWSLVGSEFRREGDTEIGEVCGLDGAGERFVTSEMFAGVAFVMELVDGSWERIGADMTDERGRVGTGSGAISGDGRVVVAAGALAREGYVMVCTLER